jgi:hypothetical protein
MNSVGCPVLGLLLQIGSHLDSHQSADWYQPNLLLQQTLTNKKSGGKKERIIIIIIGKNVVPLNKTQTKFLIFNIKHT